MPQNYSDQLIDFYKNLQPPGNLATGISVLYPQQNKEVMDLVKLFFKKFYADKQPRRLMFGINPGRFGAGITGINFTAPRQLNEYCGIAHPFKDSSELSAEFIYDVITHYGGVKKIYSKWFISAVCPFGFVRSASSTTGSRKISEKNMNYYDDKKLMAAVTPFIVECIHKQVAMGFHTDYCICIGGEKNYKFLCRLNKEFSWFAGIIPLPHPRFILQYRRKQKEKYILQYLSAMV